MCQSCEFTFADPTNFDFSVHPQPQCYHPQYPYLHAQQTFIQPQQYQLQPQHLFFDSQTANNYAYVSHLQSLAPGTYPIGQVAPTNNIFAQQTSHPFPLQQSSRQSLYSQGHLNLTHKSHTSYYPMAQSSEDFDRSAYQADDQTYEHNFTVHEHDEYIETSSMTHAIRMNWSQINFHRHSSSMNMRVQTTCSSQRPECVHRS